MIFQRYEHADIFYPEDLKRIRSYLEKIGTLNCTDKKLDSLWCKFSEEEYCAGWLNPHDDLLEHFADWLEEYE